MGNKVIVEFDEREFYKGCMYCSNFEAGWCEQTNRDVLKCALEHKVDFKIYETDEYVNKIKEQDNENKGE